MSRPEHLVLVAGTATEVGKTWVSAATLSCLRGEGVTVSARKPAQSFEPGATLDSEVLAAATGEESLVVCPAHRHYEVPMAPVMAAEVLGRPLFTIADLAGEIAWPEGVAVGVVEGAGGVRSPLATDGDIVDLARALAVDRVVLVADAGLGTINAVRTAVPALAGFETVVFLNRYDENNDLHRRNAAWLRTRDGFDVITSIGSLAQRSR